MAISVDSPKENGKGEDKEKEKKTLILYGVENAVSYGVMFMQNAKVKMDLFGEKNGPSIIITYDVYKNNYIEARKRGAKIRFLTEITSDNIHYCKEVKKIVDEFRHLEGLKGGIAVTESEFMGTTTLKEKQLLTQVIYSNEEEVVEQQQYIFDTFWKNAIPYEKRVREIEQGIEPEVIDAINDPMDLQNKVFDLLKSAKEEILVIYSTANAFHRQRRIGSLQILREIRDNKSEVKIKILTPTDEQIQEISKELGNDSNFLFRFTQPLSKVSILVVDRKFSIVAELKDDTKETTAEAIGFGTYSNSVPTVLTYATIFDTLWKQIELYDQLQNYSIMQKEFVNTAAHELRTPIQPILGLSNLLIKDKLNRKQKEFVEIIYRNAKKLHRLTEDILDVSRIEGNSLNLQKEQFDVKILVLENLNTFGNYLKETDKRIRFDYGNCNPVIIEADRNRIGQVISNFIDNSIKFISKEGVIEIGIEKKKIGENSMVVVVRVKDTGDGIDKDVFPKLFSKFVTTSFQGIGLGLYISKKIVEAHGGSIWAENNKDGKGATFSFSLPL